MKRIGLLLAALVILFLLLFVIPLKTVHAQVLTKTFTFTSPGDDGSVGTASSYLMRYSTTRPDTTSSSAKATWWAGATALSPPPPPAPLIAGSSQSIVTGPSGGWTTGTTYYVVLRSLDDSGNLSDFSNVAVLLIPDSTPPAPIVDLRVN